jgi:hypothetical protein
MMMIAGIAIRNQGIADPDTGGVGVEEIGYPIGWVGYRHCASDVHSSPAIPNIFAQLLLTQEL